MKLLLRAQDIAWSTIGLVDDLGQPIFFRLDTRPETILNAVVNFLAERGIPWDDVESLSLVDGPGSFTALRSALTVGNTIAFARGIPLSTCHAELLEDDMQVMQRLVKARKRKQWVIPHYGRKANITKPKPRFIH